VLELGEAGSAGTEKGVLPVLRDGSVVANWVAESEATVRLRARQGSFWKGTRPYLCAGRQNAGSGSTGAPLLGGSR
jgi:hypothetical protein